MEETAVFEGSDKIANGFTFNADVWGENVIAYGQLGRNDVD
jgi:hypothetical protein